MTHNQPWSHRRLPRANSWFCLGLLTLMAVGSARSNAQTPIASFYGATVTTLAGNGTPGNSGNGNPSTTALVNAPSGGAFDGAGNFYFADSGNNVVREISKATGTISVVAGASSATISGGIDTGVSTSISLKSPSSVAVDQSGNLYIADTGNDRIVVVSASSKLATTAAGQTGVAGYSGDNGPATLAHLNRPQGVAVDNGGNIYVADSGNNALRAFTAGGTIVTLAGNGTPGYGGDGGAPQLALLNAPVNVILDSQGNLYIADTGNSVIRRVVPTNASLTTFQGNISTYAGNVANVYNSGDGGSATVAGLTAPSGLAFDAAGNLYIAAGGRIRIVFSASGLIDTVAGTDAPGPYSGDGQSALVTIIPAPAQGVLVDARGKLYISDTTGNRILTIPSTVPASLNFGGQTVGTVSATQVVTLYNSGTQPLSLTGISAPTGFVRLTSAPNDCAVNAQLAPGASCALQLSFAPTSNTGYSSQLVITDNSFGVSNSTQAINLSGTGLLASTTTLSYSPSTPTFGQPITLLATVTGPAHPTGQVTFVTNTGATVTAPLVNGQATAVVNQIPAGPDVITANYLGDFANGASSGSVTIPVSPAVLTVTADSFTIFPTQPIPTLTYKITGVLSGVSGGVNGQPAVAYSGTPSLSTTGTSSSPAGTYPITAGLGTLTSQNYVFVFVPGTLTIQQAYFTLSLSSQSLTVNAGQGGALNVILTPTPGYVGTVNLSCGTLPADVLCTFNASSVSLDNSGPVSMRLTISTNNHPAVGAVQFDRYGPRQQEGPYALALIIPLFSLGLCMRKRSWRHKVAKALMVAMILIVVQSLTGCSEPYQIASPFSGNVMVTGKDATGITSSANLQLTIQ